MDATRMIQIAVAKADIAICAVLALPWKRIALSLILAALAIRVIKAVIRSN